MSRWRAARSHNASARFPSLVGRLRIGGRAAPIRSRNGRRQLPLQLPLRRRARMRTVRRRPRG
ncbi:hypothetical protein BGI50_13010 [Burkholderia pseudomallei]|nr:hypothetical protein BGI50_13010 [Burkholderia pseudomallei]OMO13281.1 hypothetical protein BGI48_13060 [Burkholderia pseudomallei]